MIEFKPGARHTRQGRHPAHGKRPRRHLTITHHARCVDGECQATCGDGIVSGAEECDDNNDAAHDGCSPSCEIELGFVCTDVTQAPPQCVDLPLILRDFKTSGLPSGHLDMETHSNAHVQDRLGFDLDHDGVADATPPSRGAPAPLYDIIKDPQATGERIAAFNAWYHDGPLSKTVVSNMHLCDNPGGDPKGVYIFDDYTFYPLDGKVGLNGTRPCRPTTWTCETSWPRPANAAPSVGMASASPRRSATTAAAASAERQMESAARRTSLRGRQLRVPEYRWDRLWAL